MSQRVYRQGDVALVPIPESELPPEGTKLRPSGLLRRGEHGGLHLMERKADVRVFEVPFRRAAASRDAVPRAQLFVHAPTGGRVVHGEHGAVMLPPGAYRVLVQREATSAGTRLVAD